MVNGITTNNYSYLAPATAPKRKYFGRFDADVTSNNRITGSAAWNDGPTKPFSPVAPINLNPGDVMNMSGQLSDYWTISPHAHQRIPHRVHGRIRCVHPATIGQGWPAKLGLQFSKADIFPAVSITNYYGLGPGSPSNTKYKENTFDISDQVTLIQGRHLLHFGGGALIFRADSTAWGNINGANVGFTGVYTAGSNTGALASDSGVVLCGLPVGLCPELDRASNSPEYGGRLKNPGVFIQDDFKVTPKLTLNLGLRWEGNTGWSEVYGNERSFDPNVINPATNAPGAMWYATTQGQWPRHACRKAVWKNFLPQIRLCLPARRQDDHPRRLRHVHLPLECGHLWRRFGPGVHQPGQPDGFHRQRAARGDPLVRRKHQLPGSEGRRHQRALPARSDDSGCLQRAGGRASTSTRRRLRSSDPGI